jgi:hypothetical protein
MNTRIFQKLSSAALVAFGLALAGAPAALHAQVNFNNGDTGHTGLSWSDSDTWRLFGLFGTVPVNNQDVDFVNNAIIPTAANTSVIYDATGGVSLHSLTIDGNGGSGIWALVQSANNLASVNETVADFGSAEHVQSGGTNTVSGTLSLNSGGTYRLGNGTLNANTIQLTFGGVLNSTGEGTLNFNTVNLADNALFSVTGNLNVGTLNNANANFNQASGTFNSAQTTVSGALVLGLSAGANGTYQQDGGNVNAATEAVGLAGVGTFIQNGGTNTVGPAGGLTGIFDPNTNSNFDLDNGALYVGTNAGGVGTYDLAGGTLNADTINVRANGLFLFSGGTANFNTFELDDTATVLTGGNLLIGTATSPNSSFVQEAGATNTAFNSVGGALVLGVSSLTDGSFQLNGGSLDAATEVVGLAGSGIFVQNGGTNSIGPAGGTTNVFDPTSGITWTPSNGALYLGSGAGGVGQYFLNGGTLDASSIIVRRFSILDLAGGTANFGTFELDDGGAVLALGNELIGTVTSPISTFGQLAGPGNSAENSVAGALVLGVSSGTNGTYQLDGGTITAETELVGLAGTGTFIQTGGTNTIGPAGGTTGVFDPNTGLTWSPSNGALYVGSSAGGTGSYFLQGGELDADAVIVRPGGVFALEGGSLNANSLEVDAQSTFSQTSGTATVAGNTANAGSFSVLNGTTYNTTGSFTTSGSVTVGAGSTLNAASVNETAGSIQVDGTIDPSSVHVFGILSGTGNIVGDVTNDGIVIAGDSITAPGTLSETGNFRQNGDGTLHEDISPLANGLLDITGSVSLDGALDVDLIGAFTPVNNQEFTLMDFTGTETGTFSEIIGSDAADWTVLYFGHQIDLEFNASGSGVGSVPESASTFTLLCVGGACLALARRRLRPVVAF